MRYADGITNTVSYRPKANVGAYKLNSDWVLPINRKIEFEEDVPDYLKERNVDAKLCKRFDIRICEHGFYKYKDFEDRSRFVDFSNRILLPVRDIDGNLVTFQGRDTTGTSEKKYLFPNMLPGTARFIYNSNYALINGARKVVLSEGCFDVFATTVALESDVAYREFTACGTFGKHLSISTNNVTTADQLTDLYKLWEAGVAEFIVLWDGEPKAIMAALQAAMTLNGLGIYATVAKLSDGLDPAEAGTAAILNAIERRSKPTALDLVRMRLIA
jgi:DNA primase